MARPSRARGAARRRTGGGGSAAAAGPAGRPARRSPGRVSGNRRSAAHDRGAAWRRPAMRAAMSRFIEAVTSMRGVVWAIRRRRHLRSRGRWARREYPGGGPRGSGRPPPRRHGRGRAHRAGPWEPGRRHAAQGDGRPGDTLSRLVGTSAPPSLPQTRDRRSNGDDSRGGRSSPVPGRRHVRRAVVRGPGWSAIPPCRTGGPSGLRRRPYARPAARRRVRAAPLPAAARLPRAAPAPSVLPAAARLPGAAAPAGTAPAPFADGQGPA